MKQELCNSAKGTLNDQIFCFFFVFESFIKTGRLYWFVLLFYLLSSAPNFFMLRNKYLLNQIEMKYLSNIVFRVKFFCNHLGKPIFFRSHI